MNEKDRPIPIFFTPPSSFSPTKDWQQFLDGLNTRSPHPQVIEMRRLAEQELAKQEGNAGRARTAVRQPKLKERGPTAAPAAATGPPPFAVIVPMTLRLARAYHAVTPFRIGT